MPWSDFLIVLQWWGALFLVGAAAYPLTRALKLHYFFSKAVGMAAMTYLVYLGGMMHLIPFTQVSIFVALLIVFVGGIVVKRGNKDPWGTKWILLEEIFFFLCLLLWSWIKAHEPSIRGLEKFMDFGFTQSILNSRFFPAPDMWYAGNTINYYYFGHTVMAVLTRLSGIDLTYTFNLMLATIFALCFTMSFSIGKQLTKKIGGGLLTAFLVTLAGNMQTIYAFTIGYDGENVQPFWKLLWPAADFFASLPDGLNRYWYANATRFIPYTIHEFPSYSFVVSDVHGHVLSIPFVLLAIGLLIKIWGDKKLQYTTLIFYGFLCGVLLMTNALDGPIYIGLCIVTLVLLFWKKWKPMAERISAVIIAAILTALPFLLYFKSFVTGVAVNCPPSFLADTKIGPLLFESVDKCQHSPLWMMWLLWGFFIFCGVWMFTRKKKHIILPIFFFFSLFLIIFPEFFYFKDIYPMHFRSNTMFKLGYDAFIMFSIIAAYVIVVMVRSKHRGLFFLLLAPQLFLVSIFPIFSVRSYFNSLKHYESIGGAGWLESQYPDNFAAIQWLNTQTPDVIVEADGDSYTDYNHVSAFTGFPTIVGWSVHEWLWRGSYEVVAPRKEEVRVLYESPDMAETKQILEKYRVRYIFVGTLEREKFSSLAEWKFAELGQPVFTSGGTVIYEVH